jgi:amidohydrolase
MATDPELIAIRRHLHAHPELSLKEVATARFIEEKLREFGVESIERMAGTGLVALIPGETEGPVWAFRADIDALPIQESSDKEYKSRNEGVMHACGHDVHTTVALGLARQLQRRRKEMVGAVKILFQPAEEASPEGEPIGAEAMVQEGALSNPEVEAVFAMHCMPDLDAGKIGYTGGPVWAASRLVEISVEGIKAHGAYPHQGIDAVAVAAQLVVALQQVVSRSVDARDACVLTIGSVQAGNSYNIIADRAHLVGILRSLSEEAMEVASHRTTEVVSSLPAAFGATGSVTFTPGAHLTANDPALERRVVDRLMHRFGDDVIVAHPPQLGAEDFSAFSRRVPGCYLFLGVRNRARGIDSALHTPTFDVDEDCIGLGVTALTEILLRKDAQ